MFLTRHSTGTKGANATGGGRQHGQPRLLIAGNWKMNGTYSQAVNLAQQLINNSEKDWAAAADIVLCPPFTALRGVSNALAFDHSFIKVGAQNCSAHGQGAHTGEISIDMLADLDCSYCIVGHSERRQLLGESSSQVAAKVLALLKAGLTPIICVGEDHSRYEAGASVQTVVEQLSASLEGVDADLLSNTSLAVAYEPIWAIGTGTVAAPEHAQTVCAAIRSELARLFGPDTAEECRILYGGSVRPANVRAFMSCPDINGALVGGAALDAQEFTDLINNALASV